MTSLLSRREEQISKPVISKETAVPQIRRRLGGGGGGDFFLGVPGLLFFMCADGIWGGGPCSCFFCAQIG